MGQEAAQIVLGKHSGRHAFADTLEKMGLRLQGDALNQAFVRFKELADRKVQLTEADLEAIVAEELGAGAVNRYAIASLDVHGGTQATPSATVVLTDGDRKVEGHGEGNGMIDAVIAAISEATVVHGVGRRLQGFVGDRRRRRARRRRDPAFRRRAEGVRAGPGDRRRRGVRPGVPQRGQQAGAAARPGPPGADSRAMTVNLWSEASHARDYLERRDDIPHRHDGYAALLEFLPPAPRRVLDLGTGDGELLAHVRGAHPQAGGVAVDFSAEMLARARARYADEPSVSVVEHDLNRPLPAAWGTFDAVVSSFAYPPRRP